MIAVLPLSLVAAGLLVGPAEPPPIQRPDAAPAAPAEAEPEAPAAEAPTSDVAAEGEAPTPEASAAEEAPAEPVAESVAAEPAAEAVSESEAEAAEGDGEVLHVATERSGPPYYNEADLAELRQRHGVDPNSPPAPAPVRWRCLIADPQCRHSFEIQATGAYARRIQQGDVSRGTINRWNSARAQYDFWLSLPALVESVGKHRYTRMSLGPKGGVAFSDTGDLWGNLGIAGRYWLGRGRWAPSIEFTSALSFMIGTKYQRGDLGDGSWHMERSPVGFTADVGFGLGGFGAIVFGGQYDSPLAREDIPEEQRVYTSGMFFVGFRGNILWGGPAAAAVAAHASTRAANRP